MQRSETSRKTDVLIVGAGPTGLFLATQLLRWNIDFLIVDDKASRSTHSKAIALQALSMELLDELGIADKCLQAGLRAKGLKLFENGVEQADIDLSDLGEGMSAFPFVLSIPQNETERILIEYLESRGKKIERNHRLTSYSFDQDLVRAAFESHELSEIHANYIVGCDGASSEVRKLGGFGFEGSTNPHHFYVADVRISEGNISRDRLNMILVPGSFILYFPLPGERLFRVVGELPGDLKDATEFDAIRDFIVRKTALQVKIEGCQWFSTYSVHTRMASQFSRDRIFLAGDAAHVHTPAGGQGMNTGIVDAYNLGWKLAFYLRTGSKTALVTYSAERQDFARKLLHTTDRLFRFMTAESTFKQWLRRQVFPLVIRAVVRISWLNRKIFPIISQTGFTYRTGFFKSGKRGKAVPGKRLPYILTAEGELLEKLRAPAFKVICGNPHSFRESEWLKVVVVSREVMNQLEISSAGNCILLRPDNVVYQAGGEAEIRKATESMGL